MEKTLGNTDASGAKVNVKDIVFWGDGDTFKLISKASSKAEGWMKSTKAMQIDGVGCVVQVSTQQVNPTGVSIPTKGDDGIFLSYEWADKCYTSAVAEAVTFVPDVEIENIYGEADIIIGRRLVKIKNK